MRSLAISVLVVFAVGACGAGRRSPAIERHPFTPAPELPFSEAVRVGSMLYLAGQIGIPPGPELRIVPGGIEAETRQTLENIRAVLARHGSSLDRVVGCTVMLVDMRDWERMNRIWEEFFPAGKPARSSFGVTGLAMGARIEIECFATVGEE